jgi:hypothetical protein
MNISSPEFLGVIVALIAVILSQLPPVHELLKGIKVKLIRPEQIAIGHFLGNLHVYLKLDIRNIGGREVNIGEVICIIRERHTESVRKMPARTYFSRQSAAPNQWIERSQVGTISLKPGEYWSETVDCYKLWTREEEEETNKIIGRFRRDIFNKNLLRQAQQCQLHQVVEVDEQLVCEAKNFFENKYKKIKLEKGNYNLIIAIISDSKSKKELGLFGFDFTIFSSDFLTQSIEDYRYGYGISSPHPDAADLMWVRIDPMRDEKEVQQIYQGSRQHS